MQLEPLNEAIEALGERELMRGLTFGFLLMLAVDVAADAIVGVFLRLQANATQQTSDPSANWSRTNTL